MGSSHRVGNTGLSGFVECFHGVALVSAFSGMGMEIGRKAKGCIRMAYIGLHIGS